MMNRKNIRTTSMTGILLLLASSSLLAGEAKFYKDLTFPKLHDIEVPKVEEVTLSNGIRLFLLPDHELPLIELSARIGAGSIYEPAEKVGLASIVGEVMRTGGTATHSGEEIDELLESLAASVETSIELSYASATLSALEEDIDQALPILADILRNPIFPEDKIELAKIQERSAIARRNDDPNEIASREFRKLIYGADSPYARTPEYATIDRITRDDLVAFHKRFFHPENVMIGVWGDFTIEEMRARLEAVFGDWKGDGPYEAPPFPEVHYTFDSSIHLVRKTDIDQTYIYMGHIGGLRRDPEFYALTILNDILGGGFSSRLFRNVRDKLGLAYSVFGVYLANYKVPGVFIVGCQTKGETTVKALRAMKAEVERITQEPVTEEELERAKESYLNAFVFNFDTKGEIVQRLMTYAYYGYPLDFLEKTKANIERVTREDVLAAARKFIHPESLRILAVGNPERFDEPLETIGPVEEIDITIPVPKEELPEATADAVAQGKARLEAALEAIGGRQAAEKISSYRMTAEVEVSMQGQTMQMTVTDIGRFPDLQRQEMQLPFGTVTLVRNGESGWSKNPQGVAELSEAQRREMQNAMMKKLFFLLREFEQKDYEVQALAPVEEEGKRYDVVHIASKDFAMKLYLDPETALPLKRIAQEKVMGRMAKVEERYSDYRTVAGIRFPHRIETLADGKPFSTTIVKSLEVNIPIDPKQFEKP
ncbi:MAG: insulinase family protein [Deltaproteobacteria bacterium]|nr:MAG: insulinase family protein [Deltaproteobacteria bacterium]